MPHSSEFAFLVFEAFFFAISYILVDNYKDEAMGISF